ncbi:hypothetical protein [Klenkia sp. PcliD-1-E]|uniref:AMIN-like domain-containing (lipo)protein n=1 Tax=Klenkia sp. PcliD-1-E TaxID=2954492 RepID=UPI002097E9D7|nr:hypothetical protein [Klenkia sp. PcliD-1-E]MCO7222278.1 hypothetical protein [Klenkia sp. PcliD-1-E]
MRSGTLARGLAAVPLSALVLLTGCGDGGTDEAASTSTSSSAPAAPTTTVPPTTVPSTTTGAVDEVTDAAPFPADTSPSTADAVAGEGPTVVTDVRQGAQDGFDRVVLELSGTAVPGWDVGYAEAPTQAGSGTPVELAGTAFLRVTLTGTTNPYEAPGVTEVARGTYQGPGEGPVLAVYYDSVFEGQALVYVGLDTRRPFRVQALTNPTRVVVDVAR